MGGVREGELLQVGEGEEWVHILRGEGTGEEEEEEGEGRRRGRGEEGRRGRRGGVGVEEWEGKGETREQHATVQSTPHANTTAGFSRMTYCNCARVQSRSRS